MYLWIERDAGRAREFGLQPQAKMADSDGEKENVTDEVTLQLQVGGIYKEDEETNLGVL